MSKYYIHPYSNHQLNSYQNNDTITKGKRYKRIEYIKKKYVYASSPKFIFNLNEFQILLEQERTTMLLDIKKKKIIAARRKYEFSYPLVDSDNKYYHQGIAGLHKFDIKSILDIENDEKYFLTYLHGLSDFNELKLFFPKKNYYIAGIYYPQNHYRAWGHLKIFSEDYSGDDDIRLWEHKFDKTDLMVPVLNDSFIVAQKNKITIINLQGKITKELKVECDPQWISVGPNEYIYMIGKKKGKESSSIDNYITVFDSRGNVIGENLLSIPYANQPPIVGNEKNIYIIGDEKVEAFNHSKKLWEYELQKTYKIKGYGFKSQKATVVNNGNLLISDGNRILNLNKSGSPVWTYKGEKEDIYFTPPILDGKGRVVVATKQYIDVIK
jgi:hypothetical protein